MEKQQTALLSYIEANLPIIYINTVDFHAFDSMLEEINTEIGAEIYEFNEGFGCVNFKTKQPLSGKKYTADVFLDMLFMNSGKQFIVLKDFHTQLRDSNTVSLLKSIALRIMHDDQYETTVFIVSAQQVIPPELEKFITVYEIPLPNTEECTRIIRQFAQDTGIIVTENVQQKLARYLKGFSGFEIQQILTLAYQQSGELSETDLDFILAEKEQIIKKSGTLKLIHAQENFGDIGGLENLKEWLQRKAKILSDLEQATRYGVAIPKGVLVVGMPGCGKSLAAKATANVFNIPLLHFDIGNLLGKYLGESEENMRQVLRLAEAISPAVLWVDEIEKAFAGVGSDGHEVTIRLFGYFLTWLQEKDSSVFVVATANDLSHLPPELLRKGRFDEIFFVDFPTPTEREQIIKLHLQKRHKLHSGIDIQKLVTETDKYTGADIESVILAAIETSFLAGSSKLTTEGIVHEIKSTKAMAVSLGDKIKSLQESLKNLDVKKASK